MLQAEVGSLKANPDRDAEGIVVEAYLGKGLGTVATALVKRGTNRVGDFFVAGRDTRPSSCFTFDNQQVSNEGGRTEHTSKSGRLRGEPAAGST